MREELSHEIVLVEEKRVRRIPQGPRLRALLPLMSELKLRPLGRTEPRGHTEDGSIEKEFLTSRTAFGMTLFIFLEKVGRSKVRPLH